METKNPNVAGMFYPGNKDELENFIKTFFDKIGEIEQNENIPKAFVCPHAGYIYSGIVAAYSYKLIASKIDKISNTFIIMAPSHRAYFKGVGMLNCDFYKTPLGEVKINKTLCNELESDYGEFFSFNEFAFNEEHSLEVQLPFLQHIYKNKDFSIIPLVFGETDSFRIGEILLSFLKKHDTTIIVSSDLSHYEPYRIAQEIDKNTINLFLSKNIPGIIKEANACGKGPWTSLTQIAIAKNRNTKLLKYLNSGDTAGDKDAVVGYANVVYY
ncbi:MAG: AmmeMemoRadiSam system protein B [Candidatus Gracilibacteria bacterium]|nr:AmmeMemoRadiSam system protein B [Candidatus Gracilibacteria bacterium]MDD3120443.1 AmmeMemoRadiSam system protein B [Candidatus Gracilibacteria bacterium]MDD4530925.1 AmmeMemoRadiSam system protein B [Candidatus Gracilibacteria bacterium]